MELVRIDSFPSRGMADTAASALRAAGLHPRVTGEGTATITGMWAFGSDQIDVLVPADEHEQAREVLTGTR